MVSINEQKRTKVGRAMELRAELFDIANFLAGEETGRLAVELHQACNAILRVHQEINRKPPRVASP